MNLNLFSFKSVKSSCTIPAKMLRLISGSFVLHLTGVINQSMVTSSFPDERNLKLCQLSKKMIPLGKKTFNRYVYYPERKKYFKKMTTQSLHIEITVNNTA